MKFRGLAIACAVLLALSGTLYWSSHHKSSKKVSASSTPVILKINPATVTTLSIHRKDAVPVTLTKSPSGVWQITAPKEFPADQQTVKSMLSNLSPLSGERVVEAAATDLTPFGLDHPSVELDIAQKGHAEQKVLFGDNTPTGDSAYAMLAGSPRVFTTYVFHKTDLNKSLSDLRDTRLITADPDKMSRIALIRGGDEIDFSRNHYGNWQIEKPGPYRGSEMAVDGLADALSGVRMDLAGEGHENPDAAFAHRSPVRSIRSWTVIATRPFSISATTSRTRFNCRFPEPKAAPRNRGA